MVAKITSGASVYGALYYNQEKVDKQQARTWHETGSWNRQTVHPTIQHCIRSFEPYLAANRRTEKPVIHISLNPHPDDVLTDEQLTAIYQEYMEKMGYGNQPYIIYRHEDIGETPHPYRLPAY
ncbi:relaxase/mobilization nuclease domain-containing protein [Bacteroides ovatus]|nr:relaxase/mobilization nuclease domain-containing protein [Bacteroides ovatus]